MLQGTVHTIPIDAKTEIHVEIYGEGMPILCLPGFASTTYLYKTMNEFLDQNFQLILMEHLQQL